MYRAFDTTDGECQFAAVAGPAGADFTSGPPKGCETVFSFCDAAVRLEPNLPNAVSFASGDYAKENGAIFLGYSANAERIWIGEDVKDLLGFDV